MLTFGGTTNWGVLKTEGFGGPPVRRKDPGRSRDYGELIGLNLYGGRDLIADLWVTSDGTSVQDSQAQLANIMVNTGTTDAPLWFQLPTYPILCSNCRPTDHPMAWDSDYGNAGVAKPTLHFHADDPRFYGQTLQTSITLGASATGGLQFPVTFPVTFGAVTPATGMCNNTGNLPVNPIVVFTGPVTTPVISNTSIAGSPSLTFVRPSQSSYTVLAGDQFVVDLDMHTQLYYSGGVSAGNPSSVNWLNYAANPIWWSLPALTNSSISFVSSDSTATGATAAIQFAPAYSI